MRPFVVVTCACAAILYPTLVVSMGSSKISWLKRHRNYLPWTRSRPRNQHSAIASADSPNDLPGSYVEVVHGSNSSENENSFTSQPPVPMTLSNADPTGEPPSAVEVETNASTIAHVEEYTPAIHQYLGHFLNSYQGLVHDFVHVNKPHAWESLTDSSSLEDIYAYLAKRPLDFLALGGRAALDAMDDADLPEALKDNNALQEVLLGLYIDIQSFVSPDTFDMRLTTAWTLALSSAMQTAVINRRFAAVESIGGYLKSAVRCWLALVEVVYGKRNIRRLQDYPNFLQPQDERRYFRTNQQKAAVVFQETELRSPDAQAYICVMSLWLAQGDPHPTETTPEHQQTLAEAEKIVKYLCRHNDIGPQRWAKIYSVFLASDTPDLAGYIRGIKEPDWTLNPALRGLMDHLVFIPVPI